MQRGSDDGRDMVDSRKVEAQPGVLVTSAAGLARVIASNCTLELGWRKMLEAISGACAQGAISELAREPATAVARAQGPVSSVVCASCGVFIVCCFRPVFVRYNAI